MLSRLAKLEQEWELEKNRRASFSTSNHNAPSLNTDSSVTTSYADDGVVASPSMSGDALDGDAGTRDQVSSMFNSTIIEQPTAEDAPSVPPQQPPCSFADRHSVPQCCRQDMQLWSEATPSEDIASIRKSMERYFATLNPHCTSIGYTAKVC